MCERERLVVVVLVAWLLHGQSSENFADVVLATNGLPGARASLSTARWAWRGSRQHSQTHVLPPRAPPTPPALWQLQGLDSFDAFPWVRVCFLYLWSREPVFVSTEPQRSLAASCQRG